MWIGWVCFDLLLGDVHSLKAKRSVVRPLIAQIRRRYDVTVAEVGHLDLHRRAAIGAGLVGADRDHITEVLDAVERLVASHPQTQLLATRRGLHSSDDE
jgi:uncharacterized protein YlxP (DUF503 family)